MTEIIPRGFLVTMAAFSAIGAIVLSPSYSKQTDERIERQDRNALLTGSAVSVTRALERGVFRIDSTPPVYALHDGAELIFTPIKIVTADGRRIATAGPLDRRACMTALTAVLPSTLRKNNISVSPESNPGTFNWKSKEILEGEEIYDLCEHGGYLSFTEKREFSSGK